MIIVIRHAQSEGNQNRQIHQTIPDHRVKLTPEGWDQAHDAGRRLRALLRPSDTLQFYVSPYRRTRETTDGILQTLTSDSPDPSPFSRQAIKVWEEPRLREQDFGNFQPCSAAMERMWRERADYGHFFYRIPDGESAADAYDRVSGFNETLWRSFSEDDFPSVCVLVTHGLMTRVFLMKWYHWSVEYFEDLRNVNHCEFVIMQRSLDNGKFLLQNQLRTWSELKRRAAAERGEDPARVQSPTVPARKRWGGCPIGCEHARDDYPKRPKRRDTKDALPEPEIQAAAKAVDGTTDLPQEPPKATPAEDDDEAFPKPPAEPSTELDLRQIRSNTAMEFSERLKQAQRIRNLPSYLEAGRDFGGSTSGAATPAAETDQDPLDTARRKKSDDDTVSHVTVDGSNSHGVTEEPSRTPNQEEETRWAQESGMGSGARADALGDQVEDSDDEEGEEDSSVPPQAKDDVEHLEAQDKSLRGSVY